MNNFTEELKKYFETTPREKVLEDWAKTAEFDKVGPTIEEFLSTLVYRANSTEIPINGNAQNIMNENISSEFSSSFFNTKKSSYYAKSCVLNC